MSVPTAKSPSSLEGGVLGGKSAALSRNRQDSLGSSGSSASASALSSSSSSSSSASAAPVVVLSVANLEERRESKSAVLGMDPKAGQRAVVSREEEAGIDEVDDAAAGKEEELVRKRISNSDKNAQVEESAPGDDSNKSMPSTPNNSSSSLSILASPRCSHTPEGQTCEGVVNLQGALASMQEKLHLKDSEISRLSRIRDDVESELEELTASLFEEAHKMVRDANVKQSSAEKALAEANMKVDGLETEVSALKALVLTSTPSQPNKHLHPQLMPQEGGGGDSKKRGKRSGGLGFSNRNGSSESVASNGSLKMNGYSPVATASTSGGGHRRLNSDSEAGGGKKPSSPSSSASSSPKPSLSFSLSSSAADPPEADDFQGPLRSMDPTLRKDFLHWHKHPTLSRPSSAFVDRLFREDVDPCLAFPNSRLSASVAEAVKANTLCLTPVKDFSKVPKECALMQAPVLCRYMLKILPADDGSRTSGPAAPNPDDAASPSEDDKNEEDSYVSQLARNRLTSVCDLLCYLRYVQQGLVKAQPNDVYWEVMRLRKNIVLARLGFGLPEQY